MTDATLDAGSPQAIATALDTPRLTLTTIGRELGYSRGALEKFRNGQRPMPEAARLRLAAFIEAHAQRLLDASRALRGPPGSD